MLSEVVAEIEGCLHNDKYGDQCTVDVFVYGPQQFFRCEVALRNAGMRILHTRSRIDGRSIVKGFTSGQLGPAVTVYKMA
jgi:hypothetical protein